MAKNTGGRPKSYSADQLRDAIEGLLADGNEATDIDTALVKAQLVEVHGVSPGVDTRSLGRDIEQELVALRVRQEDRCISAVEEADEGPLRDLAARIERDIRVHIGGLRMRVKEQREQEIEARHSQVRKLADDISDLRERLAGRLTEVSALEAEKAAWLAEREALLAERRDLEKELYALRAQLELMERLGMRIGEDAA